MLTILQRTSSTLAITKLGTFSQLLSSVILFLVVASNLIVWDSKNSRQNLVLVLNVIVFSVVFTYILTGVSASIFLVVYSK